MGVIEEASRVTDPTPQWPSRIKVGLIDCEEAEKGGRVREIQVLAHIFPYRKKKGGQETPCTEGLELSIQVFNLVCKGNRWASFLLSCSRNPFQVVFCHLCSIFSILYFKFCRSNPSSEL